MSHEGQVLSLSPGAPAGGTGFAAPSFLLQKPQALSLSLVI